MELCHGLGVQAFGTHLGLRKLRAWISTCTGSGWTRSRDLSGSRRSAKVDVESQTSGANAGPQRQLAPCSIRRQYRRHDSGPALAAPAYWILIRSKSRRRCALIPVVISAALCVANDFSMIPRFRRAALCGLALMSGLRSARPTEAIDLTNFM